MARRFGPRFDPLKIAGAIVGLLIVWRLAWHFTRPVPPEALAEGEYAVARVVDGDTLLLANGARIRLIGVDAPETVKPGEPVAAWGPQAAEFTRAFIGRQPVTLRFDRERIDRYQRFLAYAYVNGKLLNEELLRAGLARAALGYNYSDAFKRRYRAAQQEARDARRGLWSDGGELPLHESEAAEEEALP
ncbi:MAG: thermonuclease family protein [Pirellulales bacterium]